MKEKVIDPIIDVLQRHREQIAFAYLFGSVLTDYYREGESDVDLGIYFKGKPDIYTVNDLAYEIQKVVPGNPEIDIVQMEKAGLIINHQIFKNGQVLVDNEPDAHTRFYVTQQSMYIDFKYSRRALEEDLKKVKKGDGH